MIVQTNVFGIVELVSIRFVLHFEHVVIVLCRDPPTSVLERLLSLVKIALIENRIFFKTLSRSIYTMFLIEDSGKGVQKRKTY